MPDWPVELGALLNAPDAPARDRAWEAFTQAFSPIMLSAVHVVGHDRDRVMDAYAFALEALHADGCRRLTKYSENGRGPWRPLVRGVSPTWSPGGRQMFFSRNGSIMRVNPETGVTSPFTSGDRPDWRR